ncbi:MAG: hypothetical protein PHD46_00220 [Eubacteriales bacterium]|nr:hypothetical protein [Eubacteriales bacterium]MDD4421441.1 hypothetical protein [Eubacteriales bacterium]
MKHLSVLLNKTMLLAIMGSLILLVSSCARDTLPNESVEQNESVIENSTSTPNDESGGEITNKNAYKPLTVLYTDTGEWEGELPEKIENDLPQKSFTFLGKNYT